MNISETTWSMLLELPAACAAAGGDGLLVIGRDDFRFVDDAAQLNADSDLAAFHAAAHTVPGWDTVPIVDDRLLMSSVPGIHPDMCNALRLYVPICAARCFIPRRPFVIAHMAQTLDGKVATSAGDSKWIGNDANLVHAHRLRALVDGVIVGGATAQRDLPSLNVRHVSGANPARIVLSDSFCEPARLLVIDGMRTILVRIANGTDVALPDGIETLYSDATEAGVDVPDLLGKLHDEGIDSILLEGGPTTLQSFIAASAVDLLQLHIAPILFGSGKDVVSLPAIASVDEAIQLRNSFCVAMDDGVMITGQV